MGQMVIQVSPQKVINRMVMTLAMLVEIQINQIMHIQKVMLILQMVQILILIPATILILILMLCQIQIILEVITFKENKTLKME